MGRFSSMQKRRFVAGSCVSHEETCRQPGVLAIILSSAEEEEEEEEPPVAVVGITSLRVVMLSR